MTMAGAMKARRMPRSAILLSSQSANAHIAREDCMPLPTDHVYVARGSKDPLSRDGWEASLLLDGTDLLGGLHQRLRNREVCPRRVDRGNAGIGCSPTVGDILHGIVQEIQRFAREDRILRARQVGELGRPVVLMLRLKLRIVVERLPGRADAELLVIGLGILRTGKGLDPLPGKILVGCTVD